MSVSLSKLPTLLLIIFLIWICVPGVAQSRDTLPAFKESKRIAARIAEIEDELLRLPKSTPVDKPWSLGFQGHCYEHPDHETTLEIDFNQGHPVDLIALVPAIVKKEGRFEPLGFPKRFLLERILADGTSDQIVDYRDRDYVIEGIEPQIFPCDGTALTKGLRLTTTRLRTHETWLMPRGKRPKYRLAMSEIMAFVGRQNVALNKKVTSSESSHPDPSWKGSSVVDGFSPFSPVDERLRHPLNNKRFVAETEELELSLDLGQTHKIDEIRLWPHSFSYHDDFPRQSGFGFPTKISIKTTEEPEGSFTLLYDFDGISQPLPSSTPLHLRFPPTSLRELRIKLEKPFAQKNYKWNTERICLTEIEVFSEGICVSSGVKPEIISLSGDHGEWPYSRELLTDGIVDKGTIVPLRDWVKEVSKRFQLERELETLAPSLALVSQREANAYRMMTLSFVGVTIILGLLIWIIKLRASHKLGRVREQIACDLHDQIGANLGSITLSNQLIARTIENPTDKQSRLLRNSIQTARETAEQASFIVKFLEKNLPDTDLSEQIEQAARRILREIKFTCDIQESEASRSMEASKKWDILAFVKEALNNIVKHSGASNVKIQSSRKGSWTQLEISDNGGGLATPELPLVHLEKRAKRLGGTLQVSSESQKVTKILLRYK